MPNNPTTDRLPPALFVGIDWADQKHDVYVIDERGTGKPEEIEHTPEAIDAWVTEKLAQADGRPIAIMLEQSRGGLIHALMFRENVQLYPVNPKQFARYRESYSNAGCKDDASDARLLARMLRERYRSLRMWEPDDERTRVISRLCQGRRELVNERTRLIQQLTNLLKACNPLMLEIESGRSITPLILDLLGRWPDPRQLKAADRRWLARVLENHGYRNREQRDQIIEQIRSAKLLSTDRALLEPNAIVIRSLTQRIAALEKAIKELEECIKKEFASHPDAALFTALPGAGEALAPRLLTAFGSQRDRYSDAQELASFSGIAPVTKQSGKSRIVHRRFACPKFLRQTFHEFADHARKWCPWSRAYYALQRSRGMKHHATLRKLALRWIRILFRVWKTRTPYDPTRYLNALRAKNPDIVPFLDAAPK